MAWTTTALMQAWIPSAALADLAPFTSIGTEAVKARLASFINLATIDTWTDELTAPEQVVEWASQMGAAEFIAATMGFHLTPEVPDNQAARLYSTVEKEIRDASRKVIIIIDRAGAAVAVNVIAQSSPTRWLDEMEANFQV